MKSKTPEKSTKTSGKKIINELIGLVLLFWGFLLLLSLVSLDARDPSLNHATSAAQNVHNGAGLLGSYLGSSLNDIFGIAAYICPTFFILWGLRQLFYRFYVQWWRALGFIGLAICLMVSGSAWHFTLGDVVGGGLIGNFFYGLTAHFLGQLGSLLIACCLFLISIQLIFGFSWLTLLCAAWLWILSCIRAEAPQDPEPTDTHHNKQASTKSTKNASVQTRQQKGAHTSQNSIAPSLAPHQLSSDEQPLKQNLWARLWKKDKENKEVSHYDESLNASGASAACAHEIVENINTASATQKTQGSVSQGQGRGGDALVHIEENNEAQSDKSTSSQALATNLNVEKAPIIDSYVEEVKASTPSTDSFNGTVNSHEDVQEQTSFTSPWARISDITQDVEYSHTLENTLHEDTIVGLEAISTQSMSGPNGGLLMTESQYACLQDSENTCGVEPHTEQKAVQHVPDCPSSLELPRHSDEQEIMLDATMLLPAENSQQDLSQESDEDFILDDAPFVEQEEDFIIHDEVEDEKEHLDILDESILDEALTLVSQVPSTSSDKKTLESELQELLESMTDSTSSDTHSADSDLSITASTDFIFEDSLEDVINPVPLEEDDEGVTDLTEEEVGVGGAAKAAPVKIKTRLPHLGLLEDAFIDESQKPQHDILQEKGLRLSNCLADFGIQGELTRITPGPVVTMFEFRPAPGVKVSRIANLSDDLALTLKALAVRIQAPIPGSDTVGIEIPNEHRETVYFKELLASEAFQSANSLLTLAVGKNSAGRPSVADLAKMPHLLVAGATGAGKSVCLNSILLSFLYKARPEDVQLLLIDPKRIELAVYANLPHLVHPVVTDMSQAKNALDWAVHEMDKRYEGMARLGVRNIAGYNQKLESFGQNKPTEFLDLEFMPYLVLVIDELADLMLTAAKEVETSIVRLAQLARAAGIHMVLATQRPSVDVVTGLIKANFPCRISFQVTSKHDSRTILDTVGAEHLLGRGDMLFKPSGGRLQRLHGAFVSDEEVVNVVEFWKRQQAPMYRVDFAEWGNESSQEGIGGGAGELADDPVYNDAVEFVLTQGRASISLIQRRFRIGFNKAARYVEQMEQDGIIGPADGSKPRIVIKGRDA